MLASTSQVSSMWQKQAVDSNVAEGCWVLRCHRSTSKRCARDWNPDQGMCDDSPGFTAQPPNQGAKLGL
jgi:hypothetical protein